MTVWIAPWPVMVELEDAVALVDLEVEVALVDVEVLLIGRGGVQVGWSVFVE